MRYQKPSTNLLMNYANNDDSLNKVIKSRNSDITKCFSAQNVEVTEAGAKITPGYMVFNYRLSPKTSIKAINNLKDVLPLVMGYDVQIHISDEKAHTFSIIVPRNNRSYVGLKDLISSDEFRKSESPLTCVAGIDELGNNIVFDLADAPHLLISGTTGSGKTVYLDDIILSILFKAQPNKVKLVMVDSAADLVAYSGIPHLLFPVVSHKPDVYEVIKYIRNRVNERFEQLSKAGVRNIDSYNEKYEDQMPHIVVIIDKYFSYTYEMPEDFEECIRGIARKGRAAGVHLIINAQSARTEVINSELKANIPYRIAFSVTDWHESKAILDKTGAQKLLGNGDMLLSQGFNSSPLHIQAPIVELDEIKSVVSYIKKANGTADYINSFNKNRAPIENNRLYIIELLESISQVNSVDIFFIQQKMDSTYREAVEAIDFLEKNKAISRFSGGKGRIVDHKTVNRLLDIYENN